MFANEARAPRLAFLMKDGIHKWRLGLGAAHAVCLDINLYTLIHDAHPRISFQLHRFIAMRFSLLLFCVAFIQIDVSFANENVPYYDLFGSSTSLDPGAENVIAWNNMVDERPIGDVNSNFDIYFPTSDDSTTDYLFASCPSSDTLRARDGASYCPQPPQTEHILSFPTLDQLENSINSPGSGDKSEALPQNNMLQFFRADAKCPPTASNHLCCICPDDYALEVCQDCLPCKQPLPTQHISRLPKRRLFATPKSLKQSLTWSIQTHSFVPRRILKFAALFMAVSG